MHSNHYAPTGNSYVNPGNSYVHPGNYLGTQPPRCECHDCTQARYRTANPLSALGDGANRLGSLGDGANRLGGTPPNQFPIGTIISSC